MQTCRCDVEKDQLYRLISTLRLHAILVFGVVKTKEKVIYALHTAEKADNARAFGPVCMTHADFPKAALLLKEVIMSADTVLALPTFASLPHLAAAMMDAGLPQHMRDRALSGLVGEKFRSMALKAEATSAHLLPETPFDHLTGDPRQN
jgi:hypothetical protein